MSIALVSAAIDFGTSFSSWALSFRHQFEQEPTRVYAKRWKTSSGNVLSHKTPTTLLIQPDGKTPHSFGYEAEKKYATLSEARSNTGWYLFEEFKMQLHNKHIDRNLQLTDISGKSLPAKTVFSLSIKVLKDDLLEAVKTGLGSRDSGSRHGKEEGETPVIAESEIKWVITVPAIWNDAAKQFMRECAEEAGIPGDNIIIGLEPEVASIFCRFLPAADCEGSLSGLEPGSVYMMLDAGGGTVDFVVHELADNGRLMEKHKASGGNWGGTRVNHELLDFFCRVFGQNIMQDLKTNCMEDYLQLICDIEVKKRLTKSEVGETVTLRIPVSFRDTVEENGMTLEQAIERSDNSKGLSVSKDKLRFDFELFRSFFSPSVSKIEQHVAQVLENKDAAGCKTILMVGGFSNSIILQQAIKNRFPSINIVVPTDAELCVIKGAVIFGHNPSFVAARKLKYTYGTKIIHEKSESCNHPAGETKDVFGKIHCDNVFDIHARVGQLVHLGEEQRARLYRPVNPLQTDLSIFVYSSTEENPFFVTDESSTCIGTLKMTVTPDILGALLGMPIGSGISVSFLFGGTEIKVKGVDLSSEKEYKLTLDFLEDI